MKVRNFVIVAIVISVIGAIVKTIVSFVGKKDKVEDTEDVDLDVWDEYLKKEVNVN